MSRTGTTLEAVKTFGPIPKTMRAGVYREKGIVRVEEVAVSHFGDGDFLDTDDALFAVHTSAHGLGDGAKRLHSFQRCSGPAHRAATSWSSGGGQPCV